MNRVEIYTNPLCGFCHAAKRLLDRKGIKFIEYEVNFDLSLKKEMIERAEGRHTFPQIFIGGLGIGGCDELHGLEASGNLDGMLEAIR